MSNPLFGTRGPMIARELQGAGGSKGLGAIVFPATVNAADPAGLTDGDLSLLSIDATGRLRCVLSGPSPAGVVGVQPAVLADSTGSTVRAVGPAAGTILATLTPAAGTYDVEVHVNYDAGAPAAPEINNMQYREGAGVVAVLMVTPVLHTNVGKRFKFRSVLAGGVAIDVQVIANATAAVGYTATIIATRIA